MDPEASNKNIRSPPNPCRVDRTRVQWDLYDAGPFATAPAAIMIATHLVTRMDGKRCGIRG